MIQGAQTGGTTPPRSAPNTESAPPVPPSKVALEPLPATPLDPTEEAGEENLPYAGAPRVARSSGTAGEIEEDEEAPVVGVANDRATGSREVGRTGSAAGVRPIPGETENEGEDEAVVGMDRDSSTRRGWMDQKDPGQFAFIATSLVDADRAEQVAGRLEREGLPIYHRRVQLHDKNFRRVWVGPFASRQEATSAWNKTRRILGQDPEALQTVAAGNP
ncbi:MAG: SPOR domain-containing protein [Magnetococcales bacterium]|nr:SPOR domain-containing protein [Magnetococcales bacterium]